MTEITISKSTRFIKLSLLVLFGIPSIICCLYIIYNVIKFPLFRQRFQNQILIILTFLVLFDTIFKIPTTFSFYARGYVLPESGLFCHIWQIVDYSLTACIIWCKAMFTLQRYVLVFYSHRLRTQRQKLIFHYIPLISMLLYLNLFYICYNLFGPCDHDLQLDQLLCGDQCIDQHIEVSAFNWLFNIVFPAFIVIFGSLFLLVRVLWTRREMQRNLRNWSKNWKMVTQLLGISIIYAVVWLPLSVFSIITIFDYSHQSINTTAHHLYYVTYLCQMSVPIIALFFWPEIMQRLRRRIRPSTIPSVTLGPISTY